MAICCYQKNELIEMNGKFVDKECAFPDLEGNQNAIMLYYKNGHWKLSLWNSFIDGNGLVACGWERWGDGTLPEMLEQIMRIAANIEKGE